MRRIVVSLRSCPTRLLGPYGCEWTRTPNLDQFAAQSLVFDSHWARHIDREIPLPSYVQIVNGFDLSRGNEAIERIDASENAAVLLEIDPFSLPWGEWKEGAIHWEDETVRESFWQEVDRVVSEFDRQWGEILSFLESQANARDAMVVLTAQAGLPTGEHGLLGGSHSRLHRELLQLPLILRFPGQEFAGDRIAGMTTDTDFAGMLGCRTRDEWVKFVADSNVGLAEVISARGLPIRDAAIRTGDSCLIQSLVDTDTPPMLFDLPDDRFEINDVATRQHDRTDELRHRLELGLNDIRAARTAQS